MCGNTRKYNNKYSLLRQVLLDCLKIKLWMTWGDSYELNIANPEDEIVALAVVLTIDCVMEASSSASVTVSNN